MGTHDTELVISIPTSKQGELPGGTPEEHAKSSRSRAHLTLKALFPNDYWTLQEGIAGDRFELKVAVKTRCLKQFRAKIAELGFTEHRKNGVDLSDEAAGRRS